MRDLKRRLLDMVADDLAGIEKELHAHLRPHLDLVQETAGHLLFSGGKRFRPLLMVLCARLCGYEGDSDHKFSTAFEYIHAATLLHDDVVDGGTLRRGRPAAHKVYGGATTVLVGDFLLARALSIGADTGKLKVIQVLSQVTEDMAQGEIHQLMRKGHLELTEDEYMDVIRRKTAVLIQGACRVGAIIADADERLERALGDYGLHVGLAFQMADDLLDYTAETAALGKIVGADLREGKITLPLIAARLQAEPEARKRMDEMIGNPSFSEDAFFGLVEELSRCGGIDYTRNRAEEHIRAAKKALGVFEPSETKDILNHVADFALARKA